MKVLSSIDIIKSNPEKYYLPPNPSGQELASLLVRDALVLGETDVTVTQREKWFVVSSHTDWLVRNFKNINNWGEIFNSLIPFPELGEHQHRSEIFINAFAEHIIISSGNKCVSLKGGTPTQPDKFIIKKEFSVCFKM